MGINQQKRRSIRLKDYDYSKPGYYFITICSSQKQCLFGTIEFGKAILNNLGKVAERCWGKIPEHYPNVLKLG